jgi:8-oxo-dGTP pyrophosphatase MutT (NUDIX family)
LHDALLREATEELGVATTNVEIDDVLAFVCIGAVVNGVPRANLFYRVTVPEAEIKPGKEVSEQQWFGLDELSGLYISPGTDNAIEELRKMLN